MLRSADLQVHFYDYASDALDPATYPRAKFISEFGYIPFSTVSYLWPTVSSRSLDDPQSRVICDHQRRGAVAHLSWHMMHAPSLNPS